MHFHAINLPLKFYKDVLIIFNNYTINNIFELIFVKRIVNKICVIYKNFLIRTSVKSYAEKLNINTLTHIPLTKCSSNFLFIHPFIVPITKCLHFV